MLRNRKRFRGQHDIPEEDSRPSSTNQLLPDERNPMLNPVVLSIVFEHSELWDLPDFRRVSKLWYSVSLARIRKEMTVDIIGLESCIYNWDWFRKGFNPVGVPFRNFRVSCMEFRKTSRSSSKVAKDPYSRPRFQPIYKNIEHLLGNYGQFIRKLELCYCRIYSETAFKKTIFEDTPNLEKLKIERVVNLSRKLDNRAMRTVQSNLKSLTVTWFESSYSYGEEGPFPVSWDQLFFQFPKIEKLKLHVDDVEATTGLLYVYASLDHIPLKELKINFIKSEHSTSLQEFYQLPKLKLATLHMRLCAGEEEEGILQAAMRMQGHTLQKLCVSTSDPTLKYDASELHNNFPFQGGNLEQLTHLWLLGSVYQKQNFHFLKQTPNLEVLCLITRSNEPALGDLSLERVKETVFPFLKKFRVNSSLSEEEMKIMVKMMPNVEDFTVIEADIDSSTFRVICENWRTLKVLEFRSDDIDDEALTGIKDGCDMRLPNITDLEGLQSFSISSKGKAKIGEFSVRNGLLKLPHLRSGTVTLSSETSQEAIDALRKHTDYGGSVYKERENN